MGTSESERVPVRDEICEKLLDINRTFYQKFAGPFSQTRARPQPGFGRLLAAMPEGSSDLLDVGCGEGRFGRFLAKNKPGLRYVGVDFSAALLQRASEGLDDANFVQRDVSKPGSLEGLGVFDVVVCLAVLQHMPGRLNRMCLLEEMAGHMRPGGRLLLSTWQFMSSARQRRKLVAWEEVGLSDEDVEEGDYLVAWRSGGWGVRYVASIDAQELEKLAIRASLTVVETFRSDGREGNLNLYAALRRADGVEGNSAPSY